MPSSPGNIRLVDSVGWWAWGDQALYLKAAKALLAFDLSSDQHFYPPLYPALGAVFLNWSTYHSYFLVNLVCLLWFAFVFMRVSDRYVSRWVSPLLLFGSTILNRPLFENFVIPWTTTLSAALLATGILGLVWIQEAQEGKRPPLTNWQLLFVTISLGLLVPTRPADALVGVLVGVAFLISYEMARATSANRMPMQSTFLFLTILGALIGPLIFIGFNQLVFGSPLGNYVQVASSNGFFLADLPEKFIAIWLDGNTLYGEPNAGLTEHYPWLFLALAGWVWVLFTGDFVLRTLALCIALLFTLYLPYGDLLPNGLWRYLNIHYFKWTFPFFALFTCLLLKQVLQAWKTRRDRAWPTLLLVTVPVFMLSLHLELEAVPIKFKSTGAQSTHFTLPNRAIDFIDLKGYTGNFSEIYFGQHTVLLDSRPLKLYRDYRLLDQGSSLRLLFIRPIQGREMDFIVDDRLRRYDAQFNANAGNYHFALGALKPFRPQSLLLVPSIYRLSESLDFSSAGLGGFYAGEGFSNPEANGRWTMNDGALIRMQLSHPEPQRKMTLELTYLALLGGAKGCQSVQIIANTRVIGDEQICIGSGGNVLKLHRYEIPVGTILEDGLLSIWIRTPDSITPEQLKINQDKRKLGIYLKQLKISPGP